MMTDRCKFRHTLPQRTANNLLKKIHALEMLILIEAKKKTAKRERERGGSKPQKVGETRTQ
jgi:hypothetical protein